MKGKQNFETFLPYSYWKRYFNMNKEILVFCFLLMLPIIVFFPVVFVLPILWILSLVFLFHHFGKRTNKVEVTENEIVIYKRNRNFTFQISASQQCPLVRKGQLNGMVLLDNNKKLILYKNEFPSLIWKQLKEALADVPISNKTISEGVSKPRLFTF